MISSYISNVFRALLLVSTLLYVPFSLSAQDVSSTPSVEKSEVSRAFEFYPAETGFGSYFAPIVEAGTSTELVVLVANTGDATQDILTYSVDAFTDRGGGFAAAEYGSPKNEVTSWIQFPDETYSLEVGKGKERRFNVVVPNGTLPGEYITAIAAEHGRTSNIEGSDNLLQKTRFVIPIMITVPGETEADFAVTETSMALVDGFLHISVGIENTGDIRVRPEGTISVFDSDDRLVASIPVAMESVYARDATTLNVGMPAQMQPGMYYAVVELSDSQVDKSVSDTTEDLYIDAMATPVPSEIQIRSASVTPGPSVDDIRFVSVEAVISNFGEPTTGGQISLLVYQDGEQVERFPISQSLAIEAGETQVSTRYVPLEGFTPGIWTFELLLETVDSSGAASVVASQPIDSEVIIP